MLQHPPDLPDFASPPLEEVVLGLQYATDKEILAHHIGLYWERIRDDFPAVQQHDPIAEQIEDLSEESHSAGIGKLGLRLMTGAPPLPRCWFLSASGAKLIQLQPGRLLHNWRKVVGDEGYPHFEALRDEFMDRWEEFSRFAEESGLGQPKVNQAELTYVNHIEKGACWEDIQDMPKLFSFLATPSQADRLPRLEAGEYHLHYRLPTDLGRLHVEVEPVVRRRDMSVVLRMTLTARGPTKGNEPADVLQWFQSGRESVVWAFTSLTREKAHECWGRILK